MKQYGRRAKMAGLPPRRSIVEASQPSDLGVIKLFVA